MSLSLTSDYVKRVSFLRTLYHLYRHARARVEQNLPLPIRRVVRFYNAFGYVPNLYNPKTFNEKVLYKLRRDRRNFIKIAEDKFLARQYVEQKLGSSINFAKLYGVYEKASDIAPHHLSEAFVMKASYASGWVRIYRAGVPHPIGEVRSLAQSWLDRRYAKESEDWVCPSSRQRILIEELLVEDGGIPTDYKFHCFNGKAEVVEVISGRFAQYEINFYDMNWNQLNAQCVGRPNISTPIERPENFAAMREAAEKLSSDTDFIRVDLYSIQGKVYFGELTNFPGNGLDRFGLDAEFGRRWILPPRYVESRMEPSRALA